VLCYRDVVEVRLELAGVPCIVSDTAGLRADSSDVIELEGMRRARWAAWLGLSWVVVTWCGV
jgi:tRNA U34 5-carboxymethylaminomethyl modifying GTPase MnmE/TrmE